jgi:general stress protein 26
MHDDAVSPSDDSPVVPDAEARERLWAMIRDIRFAMFTARRPGSGHLHSRPMTTQNRALDEDSSLWFFMSRQREPVADLLHEPSVNVVYADPGSDRYVSISGTAALINDAAKKQQLWSPIADAWFAGGVGDPDVALVEVRITHADYWDVKESKLVQLFKMAKAAVTGEQTRMGEHAAVRMD